MLLFFQIFLALVLIGAVFYLFRGGESMRVKAMRRLVMMVFAVVVIVSIFMPQVLTNVAEVLGVGRGTDLLLYVTIVIMFTMMASMLRHNKENERTMTALSRRIALDEAKNAPQPKKSAKSSQDSSES